MEAAICNAAGGNKQRKFVFQFIVYAHRAHITYHSITKQLNHGTKCNIETASYTALLLTFATFVSLCEARTKDNILKFNCIKSNR